MKRIDKTHDARGWGCPTVMLELNKAIHGLAIGEVLCFVCTEKSTLLDVPAWCRRTGNGLLDILREGDEVRFLVEKGERPKSGRPKRDFTAYTRGRS